MSYNSIKRKLGSGKGREIVELYKKDKRQFMALFKVTPEEYDRLYELVEKYAKSQLRRRLSANPNRQRRVGGGRAYGMCLYAMLGMCLMMYGGEKADVAAALFHTNRSAARTSYTIVSEALYECLPTPKRISLSIARATIQQTLVKYIPGLEAILDATNHRTTNSPCKATRRRQHGRLSGPHRKGQMITNRVGLILHVTHSVWSRMHDSRLSTREFPAHIYAAIERLHKDLGYQGVDHGTPEVSMPIKAARGRKLTDEQREFNKACAAARSPVERKQGHLKQWGMLDRAPWHATTKFDRDLQIVCGILNILTIWRSKDPVDWGHGVDPEKRRKTAKDLEPLLRDWS